MKRWIDLFLRDRSIAKKYDQKILFKESAFDKEKD